MMQPLAYLPESKKRRVESIVISFNGSKEFIKQNNYDACCEMYIDTDLPAPKMDIRLSNPADILMLKLIETRSPRLNEIGLAFNKDTPVLMLSAWLINFCKYLGIDITGQQAEKTSKNIIREVPMFNLAEVVTVLNRLERGIYGKFYGSFDGITVVQAFIQYRRERGKVISTMTSDHLKELEIS